MSYYRRNSDTEKSKRWRDSNNHYERHYCEVCNVWTASDRASILTHENGKQHTDRLLQLQSQRRQEALKQEKQQDALQKSLQQMEAAAAASIQQDYGLFAAAAAAVQPVYVPPPPVVVSSSRSSSAPPPPPATLQHTTTDISNKLEKKEWEARKKQRDEEKKKNKRRKQDVEEESDDEPNRNNKRRKIKIKENEGHYTIDNKTWLEGIVFGDILEEDMPIQVWLGNANNVSDAELRLPVNARHWKDGLVVAIRPRGGGAETAHAAERMVVDVAYLENADEDTEEQLKKSVPLQHIRILLGNSAADERIPDTLEEARLLAMGGEEIIVKKPKNEQEDDEIKEATGLTGWSTVKIKRTTVRNESKEERDRQRQKRRAAARQAEEQAKEAEARRMEEAKVANADDSALGAYDVWSRGKKEGYKGVNIHGGDETAVDVQDLAKKLSDGKGNVGFKKSTFKAKKKKQNQRKTSADDD